MATARQPNNYVMADSNRRVAEGLTSTTTTALASAITTTSSSGSQQQGPSWTLEQSPGPGQNWQVYDHGAWPGGNFYGYGSAGSSSGFQENEAFGQTYQPQDNAGGTEREGTEMLRNALLHPSHGSQGHPHQGHNLEPNQRLKPHSTPQTLLWLEKNYELCDGVCIPRNVVYFNYVDFCGRNGMQPVNAASFGKIIRQLFQNLTTRRLGTRGQSRYHYYGLSIKQDSMYFNPSYSNRKLSRYDGALWTPPNNVTRPSSISMRHYEVYNSGNFGVKTELHSVSCNKQGSSGNGGGGANGGAFPTLRMTSTAGSSSTTSMGLNAIQQLPDFPSFRDFSHYLDPYISEDQFASLCTMYRAHSQRIMDSVNKFSFSEIPGLFKHFWLELPSHILCFIGHKPIVTFIGICDKILYMTILRAILPSSLESLPEDITRIVRTFADDLVSSLQESLKRVPQNLVLVKIKLVRQLSHCLKRRTSVNHLYQAASLVISPTNANSYQCLQTEWDYYDWHEVVNACDALPTKTCSHRELLTIGSGFQKLLHERMSVSDICHWLQGICRSKIGVKSDMINASAAEWQINLTAADATIEDTLEICSNFFKTWNVILHHLQAHQHYPSSPFQLLKFLFHELIIDELETGINEKLAYQVIYNAEAELDNPNHFTSFMASMGSDFLTRIRGGTVVAASTTTTDNEPDEYQIKAVTVKQEVFEASMQQQQTMISCIQVGVTDKEAKSLEVSPESSSI